MRELIVRKRYFSTPPIESIEKTKTKFKTGKSRFQKRSVMCNKYHNIPFCRAAAAEVAFRTAAMDATVSGCGSTVPYRGGLARAAESADIKTTAADAVAVAAEGNIRSDRLTRWSANGTRCGHCIIIISARWWTDPIGREQKPNTVWCSATKCSRRPARDSFYTSTDDRGAAVRFDASRCNVATLF